MRDGVLVIGAGGFVGRHLTQALVRRGERVIAVARHTFDATDAGVEMWVEPLLAPVDFLPLLARSRLVVHLASASTPGSTAAQPLQELELNLRPTLALLQAMQKHPAMPLVYVSSGGTLYGRQDDRCADEAAAVAPCSYHGAAKIAAEHFIAAWCAQFSGAATLLRPSNLYGPGQGERAGFGVIPAAFGKLMHGETIHVWGDGSAERDYLYIDDFVRLCLAVVDAPPSAGARIVNACSGGSVSLKALFKAIESATGRSLERCYDSSRAVDASRVNMDPSLARELYGWTPSTPLHEGLKRTWEWFRTTRR